MTTYIDTLPNQGVVSPKAYRGSKGLVELCQKINSNYRDTNNLKRCAQMYVRIYRAAGSGE